MASFKEGDRVKMAYDSDGRRYRGYDREFFNQVISPGIIGIVISHNGAAETDYGAVRVSWPITGFWSVSDINKEDLVHAHGSYPMEAKSC